MARQVISAVDSIAIYRAARAGDPIGMLAVSIALAGAAATSRASRRTTEECASMVLRLTPAEIEICRLLDVSPYSLGWCL